MSLAFCVIALAGPDGSGRGGLEPSRKSQVAICFPKNTDTDPIEKQLNPSVQLTLEGSPYGPL